jgi:signal transduction histidine kinase
MWFDCLLSSYVGISDIERKRLSYILWVIIGMLALFVFVTIIHFLFDLHAIHFVADVWGILALTSALYLMKNGKQKKSASLIIWSLVGITFIYSVLVDYYAPKEVEVQFLRMYVTLFCMMGIYLLIISVFLSFKRFFLMTLVFVAILSFHTYVIIMHNGGWQQATGELYSYFVISLIAVSMGGFVASMVSTLNMEMFERNRMDTEVITKHSENLNELVESQTIALKESNERLKNFAHIASHDLREPMRNISSLSALLKKHLEAKGQLDGDATEYLDIVMSASKRMDGLIHDILAFSKMNSLDIKDFSPCHLNELVKTVRNELAITLEQNNVSLTSSDLPLITGQKGLVLQVFLNLLTNSINHRNPGSGLHIHISANQVNGHVDLAFSDNGSGIPKEIFTQIFDPHFSKGLNNNSVRTGMGLAICKKIMDFHNGKIWVENNLDRGATFYCRFQSVAK